MTWCYTRIFAKQGHLGDHPPDKGGERAEVLLLWTQSISMPIGVTLFKLFPVFALRIGGTVGQVGALYVLVWITDLLQFLSAPVVSRCSKKRWMLAWHIAAAVAYDGVFLIPLLSGSSHPTLPMLVLLAVVGLYNACASLFLTGWSAYVRAVIPLEVTGRFLGKFTAIGGSWLLAAMVASFFLGSEPLLWRFYFFRLASLVSWARLFLVASLPSDRQHLHPLLLPERGLLSWRR